MVITSLTPVGVVRGRFGLIDIKYANIIINPPT